MTIVRVAYFNRENWQNNGQAYLQLLNNLRAPNEESTIPKVPKAPKTSETLNPGLLGYSFVYTGKMLANPKTVSALYEKFHRRLEITLPDTITLKLLPIR